MTARLRSRPTVIEVVPSPPVVDPPAPRSRTSRLSHYAVILFDRLRNDSLLRNSAFIMMTTLVNSAFGFIFWLMAARLFSASAVGLTAAITSASTVIVLVASLGVGGTLIHSLSRRDHSKTGRDRTAAWFSTFWAGMAAGVVTGVLGVFVSVTTLPRAISALSDLHSSSYAAVFAIGTVTATASVIIDYVFIAERSAGNMFTRNGVTSGAKLGFLVLIAVAASTNALSLLNAWAAASVAGLVVGILLLIRRVRLVRPPGPYALIRTTSGLRSLLAGHQLIGMGAALLPYVLPVMVTTRLSTQDTAFFYSTWMMAGIFLIISPSLSQSLFAEGSYSPQDLMTHARAAFTTIGAILLPSIVIVFAAGGILLSAFGHDYEQHGIALLRIVLFASIPDAVTNVYVAVLRVRDRLGAAAGLNLCMGVGTLALCWLLLPSLGINAVGWAFLVTQLAGCGYVAFDAYRHRAGVTSQPS